MENYENDSPSKKFARFIIWSSAARSRTSSGFIDGRYLVRASKDAADIRVLTGMHVFQKNIVAVTADPEAAFAAKELFPRVRVIVGDVSNISKEFRRKLSAAYLDLGESVGESMVAAMVKTIQHGLSDESGIAVSFTVGNESPEVVERIKIEGREIAAGEQYDFMSDEAFLRMYVQLARAKTYQLQEASIKKLELILAFPKENAENIKEAAEIFRKVHSDAPPGELAVMTRVSFLSNRLSEILNPFRTVVMTEAACVYTEGKQTKGIVLFRVRRWPGMSERVFVDKAYTFATSFGFSSVHDCTRDVEGLKREVIDWFTFSSKDKAEQQDEPEKLEERWVTNTAAFFNLKEETVRQWRSEWKQQQTAEETP